MATIGYWICYPFAALVRLFYSATGSYGVSLILFTLVIKLVLMPLQMKSKKSMMRMSRLSGQVQELQKRYANNKEKLGQETQKLYAEEGVNPASGCLWSFLPMPILIALYYIIREPIVYFMNFGSLATGREVVEAATSLISGAGIELTSNAAYQQIEISNIINSQFPDFVAQHAGWVNVDYHFLGIDLTALPSQAFGQLRSGAFSWAIIGVVLIPVISGALSFLLSKITMMTQPQTQQAGAASNKMMMWMMPLMSVYIGFILPAALGVYWIAQSVFSVIQEFFMGKFFMKKFKAEEEQYQAELEEKRKKRQEEAKRLQEQQRQLSARKAAAAKKKAAAEAAKGKKKGGTNEAGRVGDRPYARGRAYVEDRYDNKS